MQENHLSVKKTARYFTLGNITPAVTDVWFVCHGYGQLAQYFIKSFEPIADASRLIVAPEALSRFYLVGLTGRRIGATWMTKEDRLNEIDDYVAYLDQLSEHILGQLKKDDVRINVLGFSQGTATVSRWVTQGKIKTDRLILWAGEIPPELDLAEHKANLNQMDIQYAWGSQDQFVPPEKIIAVQNRFERAGVLFTAHEFEGKHTVDAQTLQKLV